MSKDLENKVDDLAAAYPDPAAVRKRYNKEANKKRAEFDESIENASSELTKTEEAATKRAQGEELVNKRAAIDSKYRKNTDRLLAEGNVIESQKTMLKKNRKSITGGLFKAGPLQTAKERVLRTAKDIKLKISELEELKVSMEALVSEGIQVSESGGDGSDMDGNGLADADELAEIEKKIASLKEEAESDQVLELLNKQLELIDKKVDQHGKKLDQNEEDKISARDNLLKDIKDLKEGISQARQGDLKNANKAFNKVSGARDEVVGAIYDAGQEAYNQEIEDLNIVKGLESLDGSQTRGSMLAAFWTAVTSLPRIIREAREAETPAAAEKARLLQERAAKQNKIEPK